jgi:hypothetical protein
MTGARKIKILFSFIIHTFFCTVSLLFTNIKYVLCWAVTPLTVTIPFAHHCQLLRVRVLLTSITLTDRITLWIVIPPDGRYHRPYLRGPPTGNEQSYRTAPRPSPPPSGPSPDPRPMWRHSYSSLSSQDSARKQCFADCNFGNEQNTFTQQLIGTGR